jgi:chromosome segregation ATPase
MQAAQEVLKEVNSALSVPIASPIFEDLLLREQALYSEAKAARLSTAARAHFLSALAACGGDAAACDALLSGAQSASTAAAAAQGEAKAAVRAAKGVCEAERGAVAALCSELAAAQGALRAKQGALLVALESYGAATGGSEALGEAALAEARAGLAARAAQLAQLQQAQDATARALAQLQEAELPRLREEAADVESELEAARAAAKAAAVAPPSRSEAALEYFAGVGGILQVALGEGV